MLQQAILDTEQKFQFSIFPKFLDTVLPTFNSKIKHMLNKTKGVQNSLLVSNPHPKVENCSKVETETEFACFHTFLLLLLLDNNERAGKKAVFARHELNEPPPRSRVYHYFRHDHEI